MLPLIYMVTSKGYTLIELLVVISMVAIMGVVGFLSIGSLRSSQNMNMAAANLQSYLRIVQINAISGVSCGGSGGASWQLFFAGAAATSVNIKCQVGTQTTVVNTLSLSESNRIKVKSVEGVNCAPLTYPVTISFSPIYGIIRFIGSDSCLTSLSKLTIILENLDDSQVFKTISIDKGGAIDVR